MRFSAFAVALIAGMYTGLVSGAENIQVYLSVGISVIYDGKPVSYILACSAESKVIR